MAQWFIALVWDPGTSKKKGSEFKLHTHTHTHTHKTLSPLKQAEKISGIKKLTLDDWLFSQK
jgi:hypothetical protein